MKTAILTIVLFCIMIFPHELGHFLAAKKMGVQVNEFAFGMGPTIWKKQRGETLHSIRLFPMESLIIRARLEARSHGSGL